jgi:hypothetical protein
METGYEILFDQVEIIAKLVIWNSWLVRKAAGIIRHPYNTNEEYGLKLLSGLFSPTQMPVIL